MGKNREITKDLQDLIKKIDFWRLGQLLYESVIGKLPKSLSGKVVRFENLISNDFDDSKFDLEFPDTLLNQVEADKLDTTPTYSDFKDLCSKLLSVNVNQRLCNFEDIKRHKFFIGINWNLLSRKKISNEIEFKPKPFSNGRFDSVHVNKKKRLQDQVLETQIMMERWFQTSQLTYDQEQLFNSYVKLVEPLKHFVDM